MRITSKVATRWMFSPLSSTSTSSSSSLLSFPLLSKFHHRTHHPYSVLVPIVMEAEATPFVEHLELKPVEDFFPSYTPFLAFTGKHSNTRVTVITMGKDSIYETGVNNVGTVPASLATFLAVEKLKTTDGDDDAVDLILNAGYVKSSQPRRHIDINNSIAVFIIIIIIIPLLLYHVQTLTHFLETQIVVLVTVLVVGFNGWVVPSVMCI